MNFKVGDHVITTRTYRVGGQLVLYEDKKGQVVKVIDTLTGIGGRLSGIGVTAPQAIQLLRVRFTPHGGNCPCCRQGAQEIEIPSDYLRHHIFTAPGEWEVGDRARAVTAIHAVMLGGPKRRVALKGDEGVVTAVHGSTHLTVKFDPLLPAATGNPVLVPYRTERVRVEEVVQVNVPRDALFKPGGDRAKLFMDVIAKREVSRATNEVELAQRIGRLTEILAASAQGTTHSTAATLLAEGFLKERELDMLGEALTSDRKTMKYPWDLLSQKYQRMLLTAGTIEQAVVQVLADHAKAAGAAVELAESHVGRLLRAVALWGRSQRRLIRVSEASQDTLFRVAVERASHGLPVCHWNYISAPGGTMIEYGAGIMFHWDGMDLLGRGKGVITFGAPRGVFLGEHLDFAWWVLGDAPPDWWDQGYAYIWHSMHAPYFVRRMEFEDSVAEAMLTLRTKAQEEGKSMSRAEAAETVLKEPQYKLIHMSVNLIAALHNFQMDVVSRVVTGDKKMSRKERNNVKNIMSINLDENGLFTWSQTWCTGQVRRETTGTHPATGLGDPVSLHQRGGHFFRVWVLRENVKTGEEVFETKMRETKTGPAQYCRVSRPRKGCWAGGGKLKGKEVRIRQGLDDLYVKRPE
jgi:hypothetical protein